MKISISVPICNFWKCTSIPKRSIITVGYNYNVFHVKYFLFSSYGHLASSLYRQAPPTLSIK